ncbi:50S ribosomal protein L5 [Candidatus Pacearchaeota archaeon]|nr:50S ribosomal protein L5 [Candidatus Pacearchaeota archaeon]
MAEEQKQTTKNKNKENPMEKVKIEKVVLSTSGLGEDVEKGIKLLKMLSGKKPVKTLAKKRVPAFDIRPGLEVGAMVTIRKNSEEILQKMLSAVDNVLNKSSISQNNFSFGIKEYLEIPGVEFQRDIGILGLDVTVVFKKAGKRVKKKKIKRGKFPKRQMVSKQEIIKFMEDNFQTEFE